MDEDQMTQILNRVNTELGSILPDVNIERDVKDDLTNAQREIQRKVKIFTDRMNNSADDFVRELNRDADRLIARIRDIRERSSQARAA
jgi:hypothetical protein